jgi:hypothetical protein
MSFRSLENMIDNILSALRYFWLIWAIHFFIIGAACSLCWVFGRNRVNWILWDYLTVILPLTIWTTLIIAAGSGKSIANLGEGIILGFIICLSPIIRVIIGKPFERKNEDGLSFGFLIICCFCAYALWKYMPTLPE